MNIPVTGILTGNDIKDDQRLNAHRSAAEQKKM